DMRRSKLGRGMGESCRVLHFKAVGELKGSKPGVLRRRGTGSWEVRLFKAARQLNAVRSAVLR
ncbi:MAG: hypothetical protein QXN04_06790, partial [Pyrobaculum sp.]